MDIKFKTKEIARKFMETIKHNYDNAINCEEFGMWFPVENCHIEENFFRQKYLLDNKTYNFDDYDIEDFKFEDLDFYYEDGRQCKIIKYEWDGEGKWSYISDITIRFNDDKVMEHVSGYYLFLTEESLEKYGWYFKEDDY